MDKEFNPEQLKTLLTLNHDEVLLKTREKNEDVRVIKSIELSAEDAQLVQDFQDFLFYWGYIPDSTFKSAFIYIFNLACSLHKPVVEHKFKTGRAFNPEDLAPKSQD